MTWRRLLLALLYLCLLSGGLFLSTLLHDVVARVEAGPVAQGMIVAAFAGFILLSAVPFVPGAEIGLGLAHCRLGRQDIGIAGTALQGG